MPGNPAEYDNEILSSLKKKKKELTKEKQGSQVIRRMETQFLNNKVCYNFRKVMFKVLN